MANLVTVKLTEDTRKMLKVLAADSGKTMHRVASDLAWNEMRRLKLRLPLGKPAKEKSK